MRANVTFRGRTGDVTTTMITSQWGTRMSACCEEQVIAAIVVHKNSSRGSFIEIAKGLETDRQTSDGFRAFQRWIRGWTEVSVGSQDRQRIVRWHISRHQYYQRRGKYPTSISDTYLLIPIVFVWESAGRNRVEFLTFSTRPFSSTAAILISLFILGLHACFSADQPAFSQPMPSVFYRKTANFATETQK